MRQCFCGRPQPKIIGTPKPSTRELLIADGEKLVIISTNILEDLNHFKTKLGADADGLKKVCLVLYLVQ